MARWQRNRPAGTAAGHTGPMLDPVPPLSQAAFGRAAFGSVVTTAPLLSRSFSGCLALGLVLGAFDELAVDEAGELRSVGGLDQLLATTSPPAARPDPRPAHPARQEPRTMIMGSESFRCPETPHGALGGARSEGLEPPTS